MVSLISISFKSSSDLIVWVFSNIPIAPNPYLNFPANFSILSVEFLSKFDPSLEITLLVFIISDYSKF